jgi:hypothetical protein
MADPNVTTKHLSAIAAERNGIEGWEAFAWEVVEYWAVVKGSVPRVLTRGKNKGCRRWPALTHTSYRQHVITLSDAVAWVLAQEAKTGKCSACDGSGREVARWSMSEPTTYRDCRRCKGSGAVPEQG